MQDKNIRGCYESNSLLTIFENEYFGNNCIYTNFMV